MTDSSAATARAFLDQLGGRHGDVGRAAEALGVHRNTITRWLGGSPIDMQARLAMAAVIAGLEPFSADSRGDSGAGLAPLKTQGT